MTIKNGARRTRYLALGGLAAAAITIACELITDVPPPLTPVTVSATAVREHGINNAARAAIGNRLHAMYNDNYNAYEVMMHVPIQTPGRGRTIIAFTKPCNESFDEQGEEGNESTAPPTSGGGVGGFVFPYFPYIPGGCVGNCGTVEVGELGQA